MASASRPAPHPGTLITTRVRLHHIATEPSGYGPRSHTCQMRQVALPVLRDRVNGTPPAPQLTPTRCGVAGHRSGLIVDPAQLRTDRRACAVTPMAGARRAADMAPVPADWHCRSCRAEPVVLSPAALRVSGAPVGVCVSPDLNSGCVHAECGDAAVICTSSESCGRCRMVRAGRASAVVRLMVDTVSYLPVAGHGGRCHACGG